MPTARTTATETLAVSRIPSPDDDAGPLVVLIAHDRGTEDAHAAALTDCVVDLLSRLRHLVYEEEHAEPLRVAVVVELTRDNGTEARAFRSALAEAVRGICHGLTREIGRGLRISTILCERADEDTVGATLRFLASGQSNFIAGATLDLRAPEGGPIR